jgi:hypothetical protein
MKRCSFKTTMVAACVCFALTSASALASNIAVWTFETSQPTTAGPFSPESGSGSALGFHSSGSTVYSSPAGNGSAHSFSSNTWTVGDYYQFQVSTAGFSALTLSWDQTSSNTGPRDFQLGYSTDGVNFTNFGSIYSVLANASPNPVWNSTTSSSIYTFTDNLSGIAALNNQAAVLFRLVDASTVSANGSAVATAGTDRVDNFIVSGTLAAVPLPATAWLFGSGIVAMGAIARRRRGA